MKLSLSWIFDHIALSWRELDINELTHAFNCTTAEIDAVRPIGWDMDSFAVGKALNSDEASAQFFIPEWNKEIALGARKDCLQGLWYLIKKENKSYRYATARDFFCDKDGLIPALTIALTQEKGAWKKFCETDDYILTIDNKSVTHRADLWGHRGIAREIAAILDVDMIAEEQFLASKIIKNYDAEYTAQPQNPIGLEIADTAMCNRLAMLYIKQCQAQASLPFVAQRLARIDARPIDMLVDFTNYVMYDIGQPMHAFDAAAFAATKKLVVGPARDGDRLTLLDGETISLVSSDCIISDGEKALSLAGIMGGVGSGVTAETKALVLESANFNASMIRHSAMRIKRRTEASMRFEKGLDPNQNTTALLRYVALLDSYGIDYQASGEIISLGAPRQERVILLSHDLISKKIGMAVANESVRKIFNRLGFGVQETQSAGGIQYAVTVPTYRLGDVTIPEDLIEEIIRFIGYDAIPQQVPAMTLKPHDMSAVMRLREIKQHCAFGLQMHEVANYALYDEEFLKTLQYEPHGSPEVQNPISENWRRLVTSLIPHLIKGVASNSARQEPLSLFEWNTIWHEAQGALHEQQALGGVWYDSKPVDFYAIKSKVQTLFDLFALDVTWKRAESLPFWAHPYQTAQLISEGCVVGYFGKISPFVMQRVTAGEACAMQIDGDWLMRQKDRAPVFKPVAKFQPVQLAISMMAPEYVTVAQLESAIAMADARITAVSLIDYYEKKEWGTQRAITVRYVVQDECKTMTKEEIDAVIQAVAHSVKCLGVMVR